MKDVDNKQHKRVTLGIALALISSLIFAFVPNFAKIALDSGASLFFLVISRYAIGALVLVFVMKLTSKKLKRLSSKQILGEEGQGLELSSKWLSMGRIWVGATCCGKAERIFDLAKDWAATRRQFGKSIGTFQATGFRIADMAIGLKTADLLVADAVTQASLGKMSDADAAMVKVYCSEMLNKTADDTVQIFGGMGLMEEMPIERLWRDSRLERIWDGTSEIQKHIITRSLLRPLGG